MERNSFIFYKSFLDAIDDLPENNQAHIYQAIARYGIYGEAPDLDKWEAAIFKLICPQIDANNKRYENGCKGAEHGQKGAEYGHLGGRPKKKKALQCNADATDFEQITPQNPPENPRNVNVNDNVNDNVNGTTVVVCNARTRAREAFCKAYAVTDDDTTTTDIDFDALSKAYSESSKWLQKKPHARRLSWAVKNYTEIIAGKYADFECPTPFVPAKRDEAQIAKDMAADKASELKQRLLESDPEFYENEKALRLAQLRTAKGETVPLGNLLAQRYVILSRHNLTSRDIGDDYSAEATQ